MPIEIKVPLLPESVADAVVAKWYKKVGDSVARDENLVDLETDKVMLEVPAPKSGVIEKIIVTNTGQQEITSFVVKVTGIKDIYFNNEVYISPETVREQNPKYLIVRKLETEKQNQNYQTQHSKPIQQKSLRESIIDLIKNSESNGGISMEILNSSTGMSSETVSNEIGRLLEEGTIFEPRPGIVRWLG